MKRWPLRPAYAGATLALLASAWAAEPAAAHLTVEPRLVTQGSVTDLLVELPRLRPGTPPVRLEIRGNGLEVLFSRLREVVDGETRWDVRARADVPPGPLPLVLRAGFADGESVEVDDALIVVPPESSGSFPWAAALVGVGLVIGLAAAALLLTRRKA